MKKKVTFLHICNYAAPYRGNFINSLQSLEKYNDAENIYLFPPQVYNTGAIEWIDELNLINKCAYIWENQKQKRVAQLKNIMKQHDIDRVVMHFTNLETDIIVKLAVNAKKVIRFFHNPYRSRRKSVHYLRSFLWKKNLFVGVSESVSNGLKKTFPKQHTITVVNAIDFERLNCMVSTEKNGKIVLTMMGWEQKRKGVDLALKAIERLVDKYDVYFQIVAAANKKETEDFVRNILGKTVEWAEVLPPVENIATYYSVSDIFLSPSRSEAFGYAVVEAAYCNNSIVASKVDGQGELQIPGAYWVENENVDDLCEKIEQAIIECRSKEKVEQRKFAREQVQVTYSLNNWSKNIIALLNIH